MKKLIIYISLAIVAGIFSACDEQDEPVKKPQKEEPTKIVVNKEKEQVKEQEVVKEIENKVILKKGIFRCEFENKVWSIPDYLEIEVCKTLTNQRYYDYTTLIYDSKTKKYSLILPQKGSDAYVDMVPIRDVLSVDYDAKQDVLLVRLKTPLQGEVRKPKTYTLKRVDKTIYPEGEYDI